ncbi:MAG: hypothetical protein RLZZ338_4615 [Cyanobacteriota bacterium]
MKKKSSRPSSRPISTTAQSNVSPTSQENLLDKAEQLFQQGNLFLQQGNLESAIASYQEVIALNPNHCEVYNNLGALLQQQGKIEDAIFHYQQAITIKPNNIQALNNLGNLYQEKGELAEAINNYQKAITFQPDFCEVRLNLAQAFLTLGDRDNAIACYQEILKINPNQISVYNNLGILIHQQGNFNDAIALYQKALTLKPDYVEALNNLGNSFQESDQINEAISAYEKALMINPNFAQSYFNCGNAWMTKENLETAERYYKKALELEPNYAEALGHLGILKQKQGQLSEALILLNKALDINPNFVELLNNLGIALEENGQVEDAIACYRRAISIKPDFLAVFNNLGNSLQKQLLFKDAIAIYQQAISEHPNFAEAINNLGHALQELGQLEDAIKAYEKAITIKPDYADAHLNFALSLLLRGDLIQGFSEYEWRWQLRKNEIRNYSQPIWDGSNLQGKTIFLHLEQGLGDMIQFIRYIPLVQQKGGRIIVESYPHLLKLFSQLSGIEQWVIFGGEIPHFDVYASLMSLPRILGTTLDNIPASIPYLKGDIFTSSFIFPASSSLLKIGIVWSGSVAHHKNYQRSCSLTKFTELVEISQVSFYSLQKELSERDRALLNQTNIQDLSQYLGDFTDTAAIISQLDLVITVDTSVAHLAGAMGKPVWLLLSYIPDWRWLLEREDSPWYPTMKLFRQPSLGDWDSVFHKLKTSLQTLSQNPESLVSRQILPESKPLHQETSFLPKSSYQNLAIDMSPVKGLGISWPISVNNGWGIYGMNLALQLQQTPNWEVALLANSVISSGDLNPLHEFLLRPLLAQQNHFQQLLANNPNSSITCNFTILQALGNKFSTSVLKERVTSDRKIGVIFFEDTKLTKNALKQAEEYKLIIAGSQWNAEILKSYGLTNIKMVHQGIDPTIFHPAPKSKFFRDRFVIFSGGKLEYRKGQDIIIAAFKKFHARHPDSLLIVAWHNFWPEFMQGMEQTGNVLGLPRVNPNRQLQISEWLRANGLPSNAFIDIGLMPNHLCGQMIREADIAVFTNRCEGGTNLVAMEVMACGIPTILSANTGHLDLIQNHHCYPLRLQKKVKSTPLFQGVEGWGESNVEEVLETLERVYHNREEAQKRGEAAAQFMEKWTWEKQTQRFLDTIDLNW